MTTKKYFSFGLTLLLAFLAAACGHSSVAFGMRETHILNQWKASYTSFTGEKSHTFQAEAGQSLVLDYDVTVDDGTLVMQLKNAGGDMVWEKDMQVNQASSANIALQESGSYTLLIQGNETGGGWDIRWDLQ